MKLGLGTVQFGTDYGITNRAGKTPETEVQAILRLALQAGVEMIDTARSYGDSEAVLGRCLERDASAFIVTRSPVYQGRRLTKADGHGLKQAFEESLARLKRETLYGLLIHHAEDLTAPGGEYLWDAARQLLDSGLVKKIGVSVYDAREVDTVLQRFDPQLVQLPLNVFDQRLRQSGHLRDLKGRGIEVHARSLFLQGVLLSDPASLPWPAMGLRTALLRYTDFLKTSGLTPLQGVLSFVRSCAEIDHAIVGVCSTQELQAILDAWNEVPKKLPHFDSLAINDETLLNPVHWPKPQAMKAS